MSCCLIVAFYEGNNRVYKTKCDLYIKAQLYNLNKYKHSLSKIIFVIAEDNRTDIKIDEKDNITYIYRQNTGLSFGSWLDAYRLYKDFKHYILCEDDYVFVKDNFDHILTNELDRLKVNYVVTYSAIEGPSEYWKEISTIGVTTNMVLDSMGNTQFNIISDSYVEKCTDMRIFLTNIGMKQSIGYDHSLFLYWNTDYHTNKDSSIIIFGYDVSKTKAHNMRRMIICPFQMLTSTFDIDVDLFNKTVDNSII